MTRPFQHAAAALAALLIMTATFVPVLTVPPAHAAIVAPTLA